MVAVLLPSKPYLSLPPSLPSPVSVKMEIPNSSAVLITIAVPAFVIIALWAWRVVNWVWLRPRKIEKCLREQGFKGNPYRMFYGDTKEMKIMGMNAISKPINLSDDIRPRVLPFHHHTIIKYGKKSFSWNGPVPKLYIMDPDLIKDILLKNYVFKKARPNPLALLLVSGISFYEDEKWTKHRRIINPAFHMDKLKSMLPAMHLCCSELIEKWEMMVSEKSWCELDVQPYLENLTSDVISRTAFGSSYEEGRRIFQLQKEQAALTRLVLNLVYIPGWRFLPTKVNKRMKEINKELVARMMGIINKRERLMKLGLYGDDDLLGILLKSNQKEIHENSGTNKKDVGMTLEEVIEDCKAFYFAGQESTSNLLLWTMVLLSIHPEWQVQAREEVRQVFGNNKPDFDGLNHLKIVTMILNEVLRLYPPGVVLVRVTSNETKLGKLTLPSGVQLMVPIVLIHRDREIWGEDANEFKPERFSEGVAKATKNQLSFFPFSWGPRICIGNNFALIEAKLAMAMILQRFSFKLSPSYTHAPTFIVTLRPQHGAHLIMCKI